MRAKFLAVSAAVVCVVLVLWLSWSAKRPGVHPAVVDLRPPPAGDTATGKPAPTPASAPSAAVALPPVIGAAGSGGLPAGEQGSIFDQIRAAQTWFAHAGNGSNGTPQLVASVRDQNFDLVADDSGVRVRPWSANPGWSWRLASAEAGAAAIAPRAEKTRAVYPRSGGVTEWFENGEAGIEHGYTLATGGGEPVRRMALRVETELRPKLRPSADGVDFLDATGNSQLHYDGLHAFDADGKALKTWMELPSTTGRASTGQAVGLIPSVAAHPLILAVDTTRARFPVTIDPVISLATERIWNPELVAGDGFGVTVAAYGNLLAIGAPKHTVGPVPNAGVVYLFSRSADCDEEWALLQKIESPNPYNAGHFGRTLAMGNGVLAVAAHRLTVVNGGDVLEDVVHVYQPGPADSSVWTRRATVKDPDPNANFEPTNFFGHSLSVNADGSAVAIGSPRAWSEGGQFPFRTGKVFLHGRDTGGAGSWGFIRTFQPPLFVPNALFGRSVALDGKQLAVGAPGYFTTSEYGSAFVFARDPGPAWQLAREFAAPALPGAWTPGSFGERIALSGNHLAVAAPEADLLTANAGVVVVYERRTSYDPGFGGTLKTWFHGILYPPDMELYLSNPNPPQIPFEQSKQFGSILSLNGSTLVVGWGNIGLVGFDPADEEPPALTGLNTLVRYEHQGSLNLDVARNWDRAAVTPLEAINLDGLANAVVAGSLIVVTSTTENLGSNPVFDYGAAVVLRRTGGTWAATRRFSANPPLASNDFAGTSIAFSDDLLVVGAPGYDVSGVVDAGAVHVFRRLSGLAMPASTAAHGWTFATTLVNEVPQENGRLGESVAVADDLVVAGAPGRNNASGTVWIWQRTSEAADVWAGHVVLGAPSGAPGWRFGSAVSFNGSVIAVGSPFAGAGRAHVFRRGTTNDWPVLQTLTAHANDARFGAALDLDEADNLIVGAPDASVNGPQSGEAYIYRRTETGGSLGGDSVPVWVEEADPGSFVAGGHAGTSVAIDRGWAFVGAPGELVAAGTPTRSGRVRVFRRNHTAGDPWEPVTILEAPASLNGVAQFGSALAIDEHTAVIGAPGGTAIGAAFVYSRVHGGAGDWRYTAKLLDPCAEEGDGFGSSLALDHDKIFVGTPKAGLAAGVAGTVSLFERQGMKWTPLREVPDDSTHRIGSAVAVSGDWMVLGSTGDWDGVTEGPSDAGQVYVLRRHDGANGAWNVIQRVVRPNFGTYEADVDDFGQAVDISDRVFVVGSTAGTHTFELATDGQVAHLGRVVGHTDDVDFGRAVAIHGQHIAVTALGSVSFFVRTDEHTEPLGQIFIQTHWRREARRFAGGASVDLSGTTAVVGSPGDISISGNVFGTVSVYERNTGGAGNWGETAYFTDPDVFGDENHLPAFGTSVALDGDTLVVGTWYPGGQGSGESGMGTIFQRHAGGFNQWGKVATVGGPVVAVSGDWVVSGINSPIPAQGAPGDGSFHYVELFHRNANGPDQWGAVQIFSAPNTSPAHTSNFGAAVALDGSTLVVGAPGIRRSAIDWTSGRAFIYDLPLKALTIWKDTQFADQYYNHGVLTPYSGQATGDFGDLDGDGVPNAWEAYHGSNPLFADAALAGLKPQGLDAATGELVVRWREALDPQGLTATPQWSRNLGAWFGSGAGPTAGDTKAFTISTVETHADHVVKEARLPTGGDTKLFVRLAISGL